MTQQLSPVSGDRQDSNVTAQPATAQSGQQQPGQQQPVQQQTVIARPASAAESTPAPKRPWYAFATPTIGRAVRHASRLLHHGGSALPGKVVERIDPGFLARTLSSLPYGVVLVSGTNGKTTTTRMVASMLSDMGLRVFTNPTGSNFTRGVVSSLLTQVSTFGHLHADIAVLELDEAYAVHFVRQVRPRYALLLNVMRDQLDRFGEIDNTARLLAHVARATTGTVVLNREDPRIARLASEVQLGVQVRYFGLSQALRSYFPSDDDMHNTDMQAAEVQTAEVQAATSSATYDPDRLNADVTLTHVGDHEATYRIADRDIATSVKLEGVYNLFNAAAAATVVRAVTADTPQGVASDDDLIASLSRVTPAFGRGETISVGGTPVELLLVKNPMGFRLSLASFPPAGHDTMIIINDEYADGRDMSWLWDVDFTGLRGTGVAAVSGTRAWDMALRLEYDQVPVSHVDTDLEQAVADFVAADPTTPKRIYCTYTAMLRTRAKLSHITDVADAGVGR
ncbi:UDP-N-acetylmuramoylalanine--D-glutamate ligase [Bifidobacterium thermophilum]|uniref:Lipid II isoglutaminyl synthase (glutamine-hydrolyzing) subunit MurT n=1 Tax=Bifidobacterium thermophilum TaxID=33905 RepID=A0A2N3QP24_9BIFI|nr:Mur ligase family protein [Bifidobacterium thermophilum]PKU93421.1 UDP-N-acetylmuramoylalanine--D-glutamate ligase [Bifidobacterium thermophilum]